MSVEIKGYEHIFHPIANLFPLMDGTAFEEFTQSIKDSGGPREPILTFRGQVLDGRNRVLACVRLGIDWTRHTRTVKFADDLDAIRYVVDLNLNRRQLNSSQRAALIPDIFGSIESAARERRNATLRRGNPTSATPVEPVTQEEKGAARDIAAKMAGTNKQYASDALLLARESPELLERVKATGENIHSAAVLASAAPEAIADVLSGERTIKESLPVKQATRRFFLDQDSSSHWYIIPLHRKPEWKAWCDLDEDEPDAWTSPEWASELSGHPSDITFENPLGVRGNNL